MIQAIRKYIGIIALALILVLGVTTYIQYEKVNSLKTELSISKSNEKAFIAENNGLKKENLAFKFTIDQLNYFNDSLITKMNEVRKELKIKDKDLKQMQYLLSQAQKTDTIRFRDTLFIDKTLQLDTLIGDEWYNIRLGLKYPNLITTTPTFKSETYIITSSKKETINPPKKCAIARFFQKKHRVVEVEIVEKSPYIENKQQRFIEIIE
jgi:hypothetical protein